MRQRRRFTSVATYALLLLGLVVVAFPFAWLLFTAFKRPVDAQAIPPDLFSPFSLQSWQDVIASSFIGTLSNSVIITLLTTGVTVLLGIPAGYAFARGSFFGRSVLAGFFLFSRTMPPALFIIPLFLYFHTIGLVDSFVGIALAYMTGLLPFTVWMSAGYFADVPMALEEAARVDGASRIQVLRLVAVPLAAPGLITVALLIAIAAWSEYFTPLILSGRETFPATVALVNNVDVSYTNWGAMAAASLCLIVPAVVVTLVAQRGLLRGLTVGAVKG